MHMEFKELVWKDITSDGVVVCSYCEINLCGWIKIEFRVNHEPKENKYLLYTFGKGNLRRLQPEKYDSVELTSLRSFESQPCIYALLLRKLLFVSIPKMFIRLALPISATNSSLLYSSLPKATSLFLRSSARLQRVSFIVECTDS